MRSKKNQYILLSILLIFSSCTSYKKIPYLQTDGNDDQFEGSNYASLYEKNVIRFQPDDVLEITINAVGERIDEIIENDYHLSFIPSASDANSSTGTPTYLVNKKGEINFPTLGRIRVAGMTSEELSEFFRKELAKTMKADPIVTVKLLNFKVSVFGEVGRPGQVSINKDHVNIFEVLALAGDMTVYGKRDNVKIVRQKADGTLNIRYLDLTKAEVISSPSFFLHQNDMVYVEPNKTRIISTQVGTIISVSSFLISIAGFIISLTR